MSKTVTMHSSKRRKWNGLRGYKNKNLQKTETNTKFKNITIELNTCNNILKWTLLLIQMKNKQTYTLSVSENMEISENTKYSLSFGFKRTSF